MIEILKGAQGVEVDDDTWLRPDTIIRVEPSTVSFAHTDIEYLSGGKAEVLHSHWKVDEVLRAIGWA